jgi:hypothetical protein
MCRGILSRNKRLRNGIIVLFALLMLCVSIVLLEFRAFLIPAEPPDSPGGVADVLIEAFVAANVEKAKSVTVPEQWDRIEEWMEGREPFRCRGGAWDETGISGAGGYSAVNDEWDWSLTYQCASERTPYCLLVDDIRIRETEDGWKVYDWAAICEASGPRYRCQEMCR